MDITKMMKPNLFYILLLLSLFSVTTPRNLLAAENSFPAQARLFVGNTFIKPSDLNDEMTRQGLKQFTGIPELGVEITYPLLKMLDIGLRYSRRGATEYEVNSTNSTANRGDIRQDSILFLGRLPVVRTSLLKFDLFAGVGGNNTTVNLATAAGSGQITRKASSSYWVATPYFASGASVGIGYRNFYLFVEGGYESNRITSPDHTGSVGGSVGTLDLSGPYVLLGVLFDGISATKK